MTRPTQIGHGGAQLALYLALGISAVDITIVNVALPVILRELHGANADGQWINDAYSVTIAGFVMLASGLGDRYGRKLLFLTGIALFILGSLISALAPGVITLIAGRAVMGLGAAALLPASLALVSDIFSPEQRPVVIGRWAMVAGAGLALGPVLGGFLMSWLPWGAVFMVAVPPLVIAGLAGWKYLPDGTGGGAGGRDLTGAALSIIGLGTLVAGLIEGPRLGWTSLPIIALLGIGVLACAGFVWAELRTRTPLFDVRILEASPVWGAGAAIMLAYFVFFAIIMFIPQYLTTVRGFSTLDIGFAMMLPALAYTVAVSGASGFQARRGPRAVLLAGGGLAMLGCLVIFAAAPFASTVAVMAGTSLAFAGFGLVSAPAAAVIMNALSKEQAGYGSSLFQITRQAGGTLGIAVLGSLFAEVYGSAMAARLSGLVPASDVAEASASVAAAFHLAHAEAHAAVSEEVSQAALAAFQSGFAVTMACAAFVCLAVVALTLLTVPAVLAKKAEQEILDAG